ncbi:Uroporphyrinogen-III C-methyltransferase [uncultured Gammaproteobacteria bacterium]
MIDFPAFSFPKFQPGWVWLAGAGPGDPGLLTLHTVHALGHAEVILHDALIDNRILALAAAGTEVIDVGKRGGQPSSCKQFDITVALIEHARRGRRVLRLKGGDPMMFGRGAEEALALVEAGVPFRILPGVSSAVGGLAYAGIPLTCRDTNQAVTFITGHDAGGMVPDLDWAALAKGAPVLVLFMALHNLAEIAHRLQAGGRSANEPVAIVCNATTATQTVLETTLGECAAAAATVTPPGLVVVGPVVSLRRYFAPGVPRPDQGLALDPPGA